MDKKLKLSAISELLKPITWFPPMWAFCCGAISTGQELSSKFSLILIGLLLTGPLVCAASQAINDWFDREVDAINEPHRPIPSGRIPGDWGLRIAVFWSLMSLFVSIYLGVWAIIATFLALILAWAYSMPPIRLKSNGWLGNAACGISYEGIAWTTGAIVMANGAFPELRSLTLALLFSFGAHGIMTLNDFKSIRGDKQLGIKSLPVQLGIDGAAKSACFTMLLPQTIVLALLVSWGQIFFSVLFLILILFQISLMIYFLVNPFKRALFYSAVGVPLFVLGMMISAFALRELNL
ncbi:MAG: bacteriochlorophyll/chlorophyll a synthase [Betaproteobacteria bacterium TMED82]|nr:MAG: bacteriochlorophyll/chlorophyll a synthase [Betaproteobacteria bacterium TMED82]|tara:strand:- start:7683 stop:8564 length:882 start_codon:yes stop_codon:yes gene_type:complete